MIVDEETKVLAHQLLKLIRHDNIGGVMAIAQRIESQATELGIRLESDGGSLYLRFGDDRVQIRREGPRQRVKYVGEFGSQIETEQGRSMSVRIEKEAIMRIAAYIDKLTVDTRA